MRASQFIHFINVEVIPEEEDEIYTHLETDNKKMRKVRRKYRAQLRKNRLDVSQNKKD